MQDLSGRVVAGLAGSLLGFLFSSQPATAFTFEQTEVSQEKFVAIAVPLTQGNSHNLLILEQISAEKECWEEDTAQGVVDPLLLNFDFTGICGRSTDSNGYSIRVAGQDLGLDYKLSVKKRGDVLALVGYSYKDSRAPELEIGRTTQSGSGFLKIELAPGWRFAKRAYDGKTLGHVYLTRDAFPETTHIAAQEVEKETANASDEKSKLAAVEYDRPKDAQSDVSEKDAENIAIEATGKKSKEQNSSKVALTKPVSIPVPTPGLPKKAGIPLSPPKVPGLAGSSSSAARPAQASKTASPFTTPIQIPVPQPRQLEPRAPRQYQPPAPASSAQAGLPRLTAGVLPVPGGKIPLGNAQSRSNVYQGQSLASVIPADGSPPAPPIQVAWVSHRYRVLVNPADSTQHGALKSLVPDAFRASYQGKSMLQVGAYKSQGEADNMVQFLSQNGFDGVIEQR
ncbi:hypothetical protein C1752_02144 [Acaryochloris thomasi RCC1774]|uniref:SPOR domain-containing protein n=1 Tax=Acaryochloris thomasi RCC1774 TaxID=1764569 RepID=A0A2W1JUK9_9CYAN|nr:DUF3747 domain-containing protein [Acaryochloris thomasi]PZD73454.1 hypothetical protein C1752_02144 [Acaryochloris thomasi RCC1774]